MHHHKFGQKYVGKVANPQDILIFRRLGVEVEVKVTNPRDSLISSKAMRTRDRSKGTVYFSKELHPEEPYKQNTEVSDAESHVEGPYRFLDLLRDEPSVDLLVALKEATEKMHKADHIQSLLLFLETKDLVSNKSNAIDLRVAALGHILEFIRVAEVVVDWGWAVASFLHLLINEKAPPSIYRVFLGFCKHKAFLSAFLDQGGLRLLVSGLPALDLCDF